METLRENAIPEKEDLKKHGISDRKFPVMSDKEYEDLVTALNGGRNCGGCE